MSHPGLTAQWTDEEIAAFQGFALMPNILGTYWYWH